MLDNEKYLLDLQESLKEIQKNAESLTKLKEQSERMLNEIVNKLPENMQKDFKQLIIFANKGDVKAIDVLQKELTKKYNDKTIK